MRLLLTLLRRGQVQLIKHPFLHEGATKLLTSLEGMIDAD
jgi:hypothetical protein